MAYLLSQMPPIHGGHLFWYSVVSSKITKRRKAMIFTSPYRKLSVVLRPARYVFDQEGQRRFKAGIRAEFMDGGFRTDDQETIDLMMAHPRLGIDFHAQNKPVPKEVEKKVKEAEKKKEDELAELTHADRTNKKPNSKASIEASSEDVDKELGLGKNK